MRFSVATPNGKVTPYEGQYTIGDSGVLSILPRTGIRSSCPRPAGSLSRSSTRPVPTQIAVPRSSSGARKWFRVGRQGALLNHREGQ